MTSVIRSIPGKPWQREPFFTFIALFVRRKAGHSSMNLQEGRLITWKKPHSAQKSRDWVFRLAVAASAGVVVPLCRLESLARVVELVDTQVSEACALTAWEFESPLGHHYGREWFPSLPSANAADTPNQDTPFAASRAASSALSASPLIEFK
jgi:hypothetical protein